MKQQLYYTHIVIDNRGYYRTSYLPAEYISAYCLSCETFLCNKKYDCCEPKLKCKSVKVPDTVMEAKKINCCFLMGTVKCSTDGDQPVENVIVFAIRQSDGKVFSGVTNSNGQYHICVPKGNTYKIECFYGCPDCLEDAPCVCNAQE